MFTGLIEEIGKISSFEAIDNSKKLTISAQKILEDIHIDDSICVNGVCLTVTRFTAKSFIVQVVDETLSKTNLGNLKEHDSVNLERSLRPTDRLGGHFVQGHIDGIAKIIDIKPQSAGRLIQISLPDALKQYMIERGSIAIDGISLTIAQKDENVITIALIPHTLTKTTIGIRKNGDSVNIEADLLGKYIVQNLQAFK